MQITEVRARLVKHVWLASLGVELMDDPDDIMKKLFALGLKKDIEIMNSGREQIRLLEIHVH